MIIGRFSRTKIPMSRVARIVQIGEWKDKKVRVHTIEGESFDFDERDLELGLENTVQATVPGGGAKLIEYWQDEDGSANFDLTEILCFTIDAMGNRHVLTLNDTYGEPTILFPDGHVERFERQWATFDEFKREITTQNEKS